MSSRSLFCAWNRTPRAAFSKNRDFMKSIVSSDHPLCPPPHEMHWVETATELAAGFADSAAELDDTAELPIENLRALQVSGLDTATLPQEFGGQSLSYRAFGTILRILS